MRKALWLPAVAIVLVPLATQAQTSTWTWGAIGGLNLSTITGEDELDTKMKIGYAVGLTTQKSINSMWSFNGEAHWTTKGTKATESGSDLTISLNYIEVPLLFRGMSSSGTVKPFIELGAALGWNLGCEVEASDGGVTVEADCDEDPDTEIKTIDYGIVGGAGLEWMAMGRPWTLGARYTMGLAKISEDGDGKNANIQFLLGFRFR